MNIFLKYPDDNCGTKLFYLSDFRKKGGEGWVVANLLVGQLWGEQIKELACCPGVYFLCGMCHPTAERSIKHSLCVINLTRKNIFCSFYFYFVLFLFRLDWGRKIVVGRIGIVLSLSFLIYHYICSFKHV